MSLRSFSIAMLLVVAGVIHVLPLPGVLGSEWLLRLYGVPVEDAGLMLLLRHRAVLFGLLGLLLLGAAVRPALREIAIAGGLVSTLAFLLLAGDPALLSALLRRVWIADVVAVACLAAAAVMHLVAARRPVLSLNGH